MRVDEARHHDHAATVDFVRIDGTEIGADGGDLRAINQDIAIEVFPDRWIHRQNDRVADDGPVHCSSPGFFGVKLVAFSKGWSEPSRKINIADTDHRPR